jgi:hypothetical protein
VTIQQAYATLGLDASSTTPDQAHSRFRDLIRSNHPDARPFHEQARASETTRDIVEACTLLRSKGFPRVMACKGAEPQSADALAWLDELWCDSVRSNLVFVMSGAFGVRFVLGACAMGCDIMWGARRKS